MSEDGYTAVPTSVLLDGSLSIGARVIYALILSHNGEVTQNQLAYETNTASRTVRNYLRELGRRGLTNGLLEGRPGYVYVIEMAGYHKIGSARNIQKRIKSHQTSTPFGLSLLLSAKSDDCVGLERELQSQFQHRQIRNEWFQLTPDDLAAIRARLEDGNA